MMSLLILAALLIGCSGNPGVGNASKKVVVLGMDGMDPQLLQWIMDEGKLPNFKRLSEQGDFRPLTTSNPPQSLVAWSNFITGMNPGGHGIFDFIHRDPSTMLLYLSTSRVEPSEQTLSLGSWVFPLSSGKVSLLRQGKAFWEILAEHGVPATVYRIPANFPPGGIAGADLRRHGHARFTYNSHLTLALDGEERPPIQLCIDRAQLNK
jgi:hypothetical protein